MRQRYASHCGGARTPAASHVGSGPGDRRAPPNAPGHEARLQGILTSADPTLGQGEIVKGDVDTVPHGDGWANKVEGNSRVSNTAPTKAEAQRRGHEMAMKARVEHHIHKPYGTIGQRNSYGNDPRRSKG
jgi:hypothetical protein